MTRREVAFLVVLSVSFGAVVYGLAQVSEPAAWIVGGVLLALLGLLALGES